MTIISEDKGVAKQNWQVDHRFSQAIIDALPDNVAVLNREGVVVAVNRSWRQLADEKAGLQSTGNSVNKSGRGFPQSRQHGRQPGSPGIGKRTVSRILLA